MTINTLRPRRLRRSAPLRAMIRENHLSLNDFIYPIFVVPGTKVKEEIPSMPGCYHLSVDNAVALAEEIRELGIKGIEIFGLPAYKDDIGSSAWDPESPVQRAMKAIKKAVPDMIIVGDVCLCQYTSHGHCGKLCGHEVDNDATLELLNKVAVSQAEAGADIIAPSDMMDGASLPSERLSTIMISRTSASCPTPLNTPRPITAPSAMLPIRHLTSATAGATRWTLPTAAKP